MPQSFRRHDLDDTRQEVIDALLHIDRARYDELGRTVIADHAGMRRRSSPREQAAAPIDLTNVDE